MSSKEDPLEATGNLVDSRSFIPAIDQLNTFARFRAVSRSSRSQSLEKEVCKEKTK